MTCEIEDCNRHTDTAGMCCVHYQRSRKYPGDLDKLHAPIGAYRQKGCKVEGCPAPHKALGYCNHHHVRVHRNGTPEKIGRRPKPQPAPNPCQAEGCSKLATTKTAAGYCSMHKTRLERHGSLDGPEARRPDPILRFAEKVEADGECWVWTGPPDADGYGHFYVDGRNYRAHRWLYMRLVNPNLSPEMQLDHICSRDEEDPLCIKPGHLQEITPAEHARLTNRRAAILKDNPGMEWGADRRHRSMAELFFGLENHLPTALHSKG
ncbi:hypothetical protein [Arthrobacter mobilis]|uniref:HNH endonuclease n=1 Tax=Arthrobacter mobilis TaxID=2724944 RepID=A0A7X6HHH8_9MICC|nr:hypothetical protein [Arthrobacter mobilis]NKX56268.1 hypothetical protein [Arthrobacter mobilis]